MLVLVEEVEGCSVWDGLETMGGDREPHCALIAIVNVRAGARRGEGSDDNGTHEPRACCREGVRSGGQRNCGQGKNVINNHGMDGWTGTHREALRAARLPRVKERQEAVPLTRLCTHARVSQSAAEGARPSSGPGDRSVHSFTHDSTFDKTEK